MALSNTALAAEIKAEIIVEFGTPDDDARLTKFCNALARAIATRIDADAEVVIPGGSSAGTYSVD